MNHKKAKAIYDEICEVLKRHDAYIFIEGNGAYGEIEFCDGTDGQYNDGTNKLEGCKVMGEMGPRLKG